MRLLHTSDWHLGQTLHGFERAFEHERFLTWLADTLEAEAIDALLIAGDVFDSVNPGAAAERQLYGFLREAKRRRPHLAIVMVAGNHDSPSRIEAPSPLLDAFGITAVGQARGRHALSDELERLVVPLRGAGGETVWCVALPYLRPADVPRVETEADPYHAGVLALYRACLQNALAKARAGEPVIALGHCHVVGGEVSEQSERRLVIGGAEALPAEVFAEGFAYVALGHLHRPQRAAGSEFIRYSGSPLPLSFAEHAYRHQVVRVELNGTSPAVVTPIMVPRSVELWRVPAEPLPLTEALAALGALDAPARPACEQPLLLARVRLERPEPDLRHLVEETLRGKPVRLARIEVSTAERQGATDDATPLSLDPLSELDPVLVFRRLYAARVGGEPEAALLAAVRELADAPDEAGADR